MSEKIRISFFPILLIGEDGKKEIIDSSEKWEETDRQIEKNNRIVRCVNPNSNPPVYKVEKINFKSSSPKKKNVLKEEHISYNIEDNDLKNKLNKILKWVNKSLMVKVSMVRKGKEKDESKSSIVLEKCHQIIQDLKKNSSRIRLKDDKIVPYPSGYYFFVYQKKHN